MHMTISIKSSTLYKHSHDPIQNPTQPCLHNHNRGSIEKYEIIFSRILFPQMCKQQYHEERHQAQIKSENIISKDPWIPMIWSDKSGTEEREKEHPRRASIGRKWKIGTIKHRVNPRKAVNESWEKIISKEQIDYIVDLLLYDYIVALLCQV